MKQVLKLAVCVLVTGVVLFNSCKKETPYPALSGNDRRPVANAGPDQTITLPTNSIALDGSASNLAITTSVLIPGTKYQDQRRLRCQLPVNP